MEEQEAGNLMNIVQDLLAPAVRLRMRMRIVLERLLSFTNMIRRWMKVGPAGSNGWMKRRIAG
ncbi:hypothetical protein HMSSN036_45010 [Paenibacillus macerans]|nr:hypothetical protein HMSSN036_45010 [Paenibacillus macerans]